MNIQYYMMYLILIFKIFILFYNTHQFLKTFVCLYFVCKIESKNFQGSHLLILIYYFNCFILIEH